MKGLTLKQKLQTLDFPKIGKTNSFFIMDSNGLKCSCPVIIYKSFVGNQDLDKKGNVLIFKIIKLFCIKFKDSAISIIKDRTFET